MKRVEFDELQQSRRYQYGYQSFIFLAFLLLIDNVLYGIGIIWSQHPTNTFILLLASFTYFISRCIWGDAFVGPKQTPKKVSMAVAAVVLIAAVAAVLAVGFISFHVNVKAPPADEGGSLLSVACVAMWVTIGIVYVIKQIKNRNTD